jgi:hypothetical protein
MREAQHPSGYTDPAEPGKVSRPLLRNYAPYGPPKQKPAEAGGKKRARPTCTRAARGGGSSKEDQPRSLGKQKLTGAGEFRKNFRDSRNYPAASFTPIILRT